MSVSIIPKVKIPVCEDQIVLDGYRIVEINGISAGIECEVVKITGS